MRVVLSLLMFSILIWSCKSDPVSEYKELDLLSYGVPLKIMAPDSSDIKKEDWITQQGVTIKKGKDYEVQVWAGTASTTDMVAFKANKLAEVKNKEIFSKIIQEDPDGFIFENQLDSNTLYYGFYYLVLQGDFEYTFQNGLRGDFTQEQAENMYRAVRPKEEK